MQATAIIEVLSRALSADATRFEAVESRDGMPTIYAPLDLLVEACRVLRDAPELRFVFMADVTGVDYHPRDPRFELLYLLVCPGVAGYGVTPMRLRLKVRVPEGTHVPSVSSIWQSANWGEREVYDFFGLHFDGHPDMRRILMPEDWEGFPMRKDYPVQINQRVKTYEPLQVSEAEFVANLEAARRSAGDTERPEPVKGRVARDPGRARRD
jgi:NADH-quinone oxidoreductase subunit C